VTRTGDGHAVLLRGGTVYSPVDPFATAMLVVGDRVAWVGGEGAADAAVADADEVVQLAGRLVTPAFVDAHVHLTETGLAAVSVDLGASVSLADCLARLAAAPGDAGTVVLAHGWDETTWPERRAPRGDEVAQAVGGRPAYVARVDVHSAVVTAALVAMVPHVRALPGWAGDGLVRQDAHHACRRAARDTLGATRRAELQRDALATMAGRGIAAVHEMGGEHIAGPEDLRTALGHGPTFPDVVGYWGVLDAIEEAAALGAVGAGGDLCVDGALGSRTAWLAGPYDDEPSTHGVAYLDVEQAAAHVVACTDAGLQAGFHCIGDAAVRAAVEAVALAAERCGRDRVVRARHRLEHVEMLAPDLVATMASLGVAASVQPAFDARWGGEDGMYAARLGRPRARTLNPFQAMVQAGVVVALGSDSPVTPADPWAQVRAAAQHHVPAHRLTVRAAFGAHTRGGWRAARVDDAGVLAPGQRASYAVWDVPGDLLVQTPDDRVAAWSTDPRSGVPGLPDLSPDVPLPTCVRTVAGGRTVFDREAA
jgi:predicted amidohydrolase YtcJ